MTSVSSRTARAGEERGGGLRRASDPCACRAVRRAGTRIRGPASSICGERDAEVEQHAVARGRCASASSTSVERGEPRAAEREVADRRCSAAAARSASGSRSIATTRPRGERRARIARACPPRPKVAVDVDAVGVAAPAPRPPLRAGRGHVVPSRHQSEKPSSSGGSPPPANAIACAVARCPRRVVPQLELAPLPDEHDVLVERRVAAQRGRHQDAARRVDLDVVGVADDAAAAGRGCVRRTTRAPSVAPGSAPMRRADRASRQRDGSAVRTSARPAFGDDRVAMPRGHREPALRVERELGDAAEEAPRFGRSPSVADLTNALLPGSGIGRGPGDRPAASIGDLRQMTPLKPTIPHFPPL